MILILQSEGVWLFDGKYNNQYIQIFYKTLNIFDELVLAMPAYVLWHLLTYKEKGLINGNGDVLKRIVQNSMFRKRNESEEDPSIKQIILYAIISYKELERSGVR
jgi:hypothetical protein